MALHLVKLSVGSESYEDKALWQQEFLAQQGRLYHTTRMWPRREAELLAGGSIYWVIKGHIIARQLLMGFEPALGDDGITRCMIMLDPALHRTVPMPKRPFQGWRYLRADDCPDDLVGAPDHTDLPVNLARALNDLGVG